MLAPASLGKRALPSFAAVILALAFAIPATAQPPAIPEPLRPWVGWVLESHPDLPCPLVDGERFCAWPGRLALDLGETGGSFALDVFADRALDLPLPGDAARWPQEVTLDGSSAPMRRSGEQPTVRVGSGRHRIAGRFRWRRLPESMPVPAAVALVELRLRGAEVRFPRRENGGLLWLAASRGGEGEADTLEIEVQRKIDDGVPVELTTRLQVRAGGRSREVDLGVALPAGFELFSLSGGLPLRFSHDRHLVVQVRPGEWELSLSARSTAPVLELACPAATAPWPAEELWVFQAAPAVRSVRIAGAPNVDPQRTSLPDAWKPFPAFQLTPGTSLSFDELRRGEAQPPPDAVTVERVFWLAQDGDRLTVRDHLGGTLTTGGRLETIAPGELGRAALGNAGGAGGDQVITLGPANGRPGVEVRDGALELEADLTYSRDGALPAVGWDRDAQSLSGRLLLPPGWTLVAAFGVDHAAGAWVDSWTLLDLFLLLIASLAVGKLYGKAEGALAFALLGLAWHEPYAVGLWFCLLLFLPLEALRRALTGGRTARLVNSGRWLAVVALAIAFVVFATSQWRTGLFPQLEVTAGSGYGGGLTALGYVGEAAASVDRGGYGKLAQLSENAPAQVGGAPAKDRARQVDPNAVVQTGPGLPSWSFASASLSWRGPVAADHTLRFWLLSPAAELVLSLLRIAGLALLGWRLLTPRVPPVATAAVLLLLLLVPSPPAAAQETPEPPASPTPDVLTELERRLTAPPPCDPQSVELPRMALTASADGLRIEAEIHTAVATAWVLPGPAGAWMPARATVDGAEATALRLGDDGFLQLRLEAGIHRVELSGPARDSLTLQLPLAPRTLSWKGEGWTIDGFRPDEAPPSTVRLDRQLPAAADGEGATVELPPWLELRRELDLGIPWLVHTELRRLGPAGTAVVMRVPLLAGESVTTAGIAVEAGQAVVSLEPGETSRSWRSTLAEAATLTLTAPTDRPWLERWELDCSPIWNCRAEGLAPIVHLQDGHWRPSWRPWPGETVSLHFVRPTGAPGQTTTFDQIAYTLSPGRRLLEAGITAELRTSRGGEQVFTLPADAELRSFQVDGTAQPVQLEAGRLAFTLEPGQHKVEAAWRQPHGTSWLERAPAAALGAEAVNVSTTIALPEDRWLLWAGGPGWGPVILFWQYLLAIALVGWALGRWAPTPLRIRDWLLLAAGLTQIPLPVAVVVVLYPVILGLRHRSLPRRFWSYDLQQLILFGLGLFAAGSLYAAVHAGLLFQPDMQVAGLGSYGSTLVWYVERIAGALPRPWVLSLPLWVWRLLMLLWALWLASRLLRWLPWCWGRLTLGPLLAGPKGFEEWRAQDTTSDTP